MHNLKTVSTTIQSVPLWHMLALFVALCQRVYPFLATGCWAVVMHLFEHDRSVLHPSLTSSMEFIYKDRYQGGCSYTARTLVHYPLSVCSGSHVSVLAWADAGTPGESSAAWQPQSR